MYTFQIVLCHLLMDVCSNLCAIWGFTLILYFANCKLRQLHAPHHLGSSISPWNSLFIASWFAKICTMQCEYLQGMWMWYQTIIAVLPRPSLAREPNNYSLVPRPRPTFRHLQYGKAGRTWYLFSYEDDVIWKWWIFFRNEQTAFCEVSTNYTLNTWCAWQSPSAS